MNGIFTAKKVYQKFNWMLPIKVQVKWIYPYSGFMGRSGELIHVLPFLWSILVIIILSVLITNEGRNYV